MLATSRGTVPCAFAVKFRTCEARHKSGCDAPDHEPELFLFRVGITTEVGMRKYTPGSIVKEHLPEAALNDFNLCNGVFSKEVVWVHVVCLPSGC
jgi:hypothetical protein